MPKSSGIVWTPGVVIEGVREVRDPLELNRLVLQHGSAYRGTSHLAVFTCKQGQQHVVRRGDRIELDGEGRPSFVTPRMTGL